MTMFVDQSITLLNLIKAKNLIVDPEKWLQGDHIIGDRCCASGAIHLCVGEFEVPLEWQGIEYAAKFDAPRGAIPEEYWYLRSALHHVDPHGLGYIGAYNDAQARTHQEIMDLFDLAISLCAADQLAVA